jgi:hypothetical protein
MKGSAADRVKRYIAEHQGISFEELKGVFSKKEVYYSLYYAKKQGIVKEIDGRFYYEGRYFKADKVWKAMKYLRVFRIKDIVQLTDMKRNNICALLSYFIKVGAIKKEVGKNRRDVWYVVIAMERPIFCWKGER